MGNIVNSFNISQLLIGMADANSKMSRKKPNQGESTT